MSDVLRDSVAAARAGRPTLLLIEGDAGIGKSTQLAELVSLAPGFRVLMAQGTERGSAPLTTLEQWGVSLQDRDRSSPSFIVTQWLRQELDAVGAGASPVLLVLDDLQWADVESLDVLSWLLRRVAGDRLLVALAFRPVGPELAHWYRWAVDFPGVQQLTLTGLPLATTADLVRALRPGTPEPVVEALWHHTRGHPFYLKALLREYDSAQLAQMRVLPAPAEYRSLVAGQLMTVSAESRRVAEAVAVLGQGWWPLPMVAALAQVPDVHVAAQPVIETALVELGDVAGVPSLRNHHALSRAAVYHQIELPQRRDLHRAAVGLSTDRAFVLEHRVNAADEFDDVLAAELVAYADELHDTALYRLAASYDTWAAALWSDPALRRQSRFEALFNSVLAHDTTVVEAGLASLGEQHRSPELDLIRGADEILAGRWASGAQLIRLCVDDARLSPLNQYRAHTLIAWTQMGRGASSSQILASMGRAERTGARDLAVEPYGLLAGGQAMARQEGLEATSARVADLPEDPHEFPLDQSYLLGWRGALRTHQGRFDAALVDLREATERIFAGTLDVSHGGFQGILAVAYWLNGQWDMAKLALDIGRDVGRDRAPDFVIPLLQTYLPLHAAGTGQHQVADALLAQAQATLVRDPWPEAVASLLVLRVVREHADSNHLHRAEIWPDMVARWGRTEFRQGLIGAHWLVHAALAAIWAEDDDSAHEFLARMNRRPWPEWRGGLDAWLRGLLAEQHGDRTAALRHFRTAARGDLHSIPFYRAHVLSDLARLAAPGQGEGRTARAEALSIYRRLGARTYLPEASRVQDQVSATTQFDLTEREADVTVLLLRGLSYAQIARDLFITQSTVSYHLRNIYGKAGVRNRHEFVETAHR